MDYFKKLNELNQKKAEQIANAEALMEAGTYGEELTNVQNSIREIQSQIDRVSAMAEISQGAALPTAGGREEKSLQNGREPLKLFNSLGEQLSAIRNAALGKVDERLTKINNAVMGANTGTGADGGFAIQEDFAGNILDSAAEAGEIMRRVTTYTVGKNSNSVRWLRVNESDISSSVCGGVQMYWAGEGLGVGATKPKFAQTKIDLEKMLGFAYATDELLDDTTFMTSFFGKSFTLASRRLIEDAIISGDGNGKPLGILNSGALVSVAKEASQAAGTINAKNIMKMWARGHYANRRNTVWLAHPDCEEQLQEMTLGDRPIWMPEGGLSDSPYQRILGRPVIYTDNCSALGSAGDIMLADLSKYIFVKKGTARKDWSMHVEFLTDQMCFRLALRCNGAPEVSAPLTIKNSKNTRSPFVTLAERA